MARLKVLLFTFLKSLCYVINCYVPLFPQYDYPMIYIISNVLHCILPTLVLTHLATILLIIGAQTRPIYPWQWKVGGFRCNCQNIFLDRKTRFVRDYTWFCFNNLSFYRTRTVLKSRTQPRGPDLARSRVKREKTRFVHHDVSFGRRRTVKVPIEGFGEEYFNP